MTNRPERRHEPIIYRKLKHEERIRNILSAIPTQHKQWLKQKLQYSYEPSLRQRLKSLLERHHEAVKRFIPYPKAFIEKVVVTRNYLTHYDPSQVDKAATDGGELYDLAQELKLLLELCLLEEIGFSLEELDRFVQKRLNSGRHKLTPIGD